MSELLGHISNDVRVQTPQITNEIISAVSNIPDQMLMELNSVILNTQSVEDVYALLGKEAGAAAFGSNLIESGKSMFLNKASGLSDAICGNELLKKYCLNANYIDTSTCAGLILGRLHSSKTQGINIVLISIILARIGIKNLCTKKWEQ